MAGVPTNSDDTIIVDVENTDLDAKRGNDTVYVFASGAAVHGGTGGDWLTTMLDVSVEVSEDDDGDGWGTADPDFLSTALYGDKGDDHLHATMRAVIPASESGESATVDMEVMLDGGEGDDFLWVDLLDPLGSFAATLEGGAGNDDIRFNAIVPADFGEGAGGPIYADGGEGDDNITIRAAGVSSLDFGRATAAEVHGGDGNDRIETDLFHGDWSGGGARNFLYGDAGNDVIIGKADGAGDFPSSANEAHGGDGDDEIILTALGSSSATTFVTNKVYGDAGADRLVVTGEVRDMEVSAQGNNWVDGGEGADRVSAVLRIESSGESVNEVHGGEGSDRLSTRIAFGEEGSGGANLVYGEAGDDRLSGVITTEGEVDSTDAHSELYGGAGNDRLSVQGGEGNLLYGNQGDDRLLGSRGADVLVGGQGADYLRGGAGEDSFVFMGARGAGLGERDRIADFTRGEDVIDVHSIDANSARGGNQTFAFDRSGDGGAGKLWIEDSPDSAGSLLYADTGSALLVVALLDGRDVDASDYRAGDFIL